jgi:hypothetical protein
LASVDEREPLDAVTDPDQTFGTYQALLSDARFHYEWSPGRHKQALKVLT